MLKFFRIMFGIALISSTTQAAVCVGKNCELLDSIANSKGIPLQSILDNIQQNIIDPILDSQTMMTSWQGGMLDYSPAGAQGGIKVTLWGAGCINEVSTSGNFFGSNFSLEYATGVTRFGGSTEIPLNNNTELILNGSFWNGSSDLGLDIIGSENKETSIRIGSGIRTSVIKNNWTTFYFSSGVILGVRNFSTKFPGTNIKIKTPLGIVGWKGEESYEESINFVSTPIAVGGSINVWRITILGEIGGRAIGQIGNSKVQKLGLVGPFFGDVGFYNIGIMSERKINEISIWPISRLGFELKTFYDISVMGNWQPKIQSQAQFFSVGIGLQFLKNLNFSKTKRVEKYKLTFNKNLPKINILGVS